MDLLILVLQYDIQTPPGKDFVKISSGGVTITDGFTHLTLPYKIHIPVFDLT